MCLAVPGRVTEIRDDDALRMGTVSFEGLRKEVCLAYVPEVGIGDWVIVHAGFAIHQVDEAQAAHTIGLLKQLEEPG